MELKIDKLRHLRSKMIPYLRKRVDQVIIATVLIIVIIGAILSSLLFYRFALNSYFITEEVTAKEIKILAKQEVLQKIDTDQKANLSTQEKIKKVKDPFK
ncbi:MAG: hypothetical protein HQ530_04735 [Parcubacteria group bacterium]|nr:hypothetical protein [Parcubacteria group bacterium]